MDSLPPLQLRPGRTDEYPRFVEMFAELQVNDPIPSPGEWERTLLPHTYFLDAPEIEPVGYAVVRFLEKDAHVMHVVVDPTCRERGVGSRLMETIRELVRSKGLTAWRLNVKVDNAAAVRLYERFGFTVRYRTQVLGVPWESRLLLPALPEPTELLPPSVDEHPEIEAACDLPEGALASWKQMPGHVLIRARDVTAERRLVGFARFDPNFPGAMPFRAASAAHARALLDALHSQPGRTGPSLQLVVEDQPTLSNALREAGAELRLELFHMRGTLPHDP